MEGGAGGAVHGRGEDEVAEAGLVLEGDEGDAVRGGRALEDGEPPGNDRGRAFGEIGEGGQGEDAARGEGGALPGGDVAGGGEAGGGRPVAQPSPARVSSGVGAGRAIGATGRGRPVAPCQVAGSAQRS